MRMRDAGARGPGRRREARGQSDSTDEYAVRRFDRQTGDVAVIKKSLAAVRAVATAEAQGQCAAKHRGRLAGGSPGRGRLRLLGGWAVHDGVCLRAEGRWGSRARSDLWPFGEPRMENGSQPEKRRSDILIPIVGPGGANIGRKASVHVLIVVLGARFVVRHLHVHQCGATGKIFNGSSTPRRGVTSGVLVPRSSRQERVLLAELKGFT